MARVKSRYAWRLRRAKYDALRSEIGEADPRTVTDLSGWLIGSLANLYRARGFVEFERLPVAKQKTIVQRFVRLEKRVDDLAAKRAARLMRLYLAAAASGDEALADEVYDFIVSHAEPMLRRFRLKGRLH
jgi:hypothetical protein